MASLQDIVSAFNGYDLDNDGVREIESLRFMSFESPNEPVLADRPLVVVLVEPRLLAPISGSRYAPADLSQRLQVLKRDLLAEGFQPRFLEMQVYSGPVHQDGKTLLAMRELLRQIKGSFAALRGALLVGAFPEAMIVRTWPDWRTLTQPERIDKLGKTFPAGTKVYNIGRGVHAYRSEIVLADLSGNWRDLYRQQSTNLTECVFVPTSEQISPDQTRATLQCPTGNYEMNQAAYQDFFWIRDDVWEEVSRTSTEIRVRLTLKLQDPELARADRAQPNPIARPEIAVSRINARSIATNPDARLLDQSRQPKRAPASPPVETGMFGWQRDADLERTLLIEYFERNHAFRSGRYSIYPLLVSKIVYELGFWAVTQGLDGIVAPVEERDNASLRDVVQWLKEPRAIRGIGAHTSGRWACMTVFGDDQNYAALDAETGGRPWRWVEHGGQHVPSFEGHSTADLHLYRTLWENKVLQDVCPSFFVHAGCDANTPDGADTKPYSAPDYGVCQSAEGLLFYANGLAVIARSKMFYDGPSGFGKGFGASDTAVFGDGWLRHFEVEAADADLAQKRTDRKRSSMWSMIGDWTLRKYYAATPARFAKGKQITVAQNADGRLEVFYIGTDDRLYHNAQVRPNSGWGGEAALGGWAKQLAVASNQDGRLEVFYIGTDDKLYHNAQRAPNSGWGGEAALGGWAKQLVVGYNADGRLEVFYIGTDDKLYHNAQRAPNSGWGGEAWL